MKLRSLTFGYLGRVFADVRDEVGAVFPLEFLECKGTHLCVFKAGSFASSHQVDWSPIQVYPKVLRLVSRVNGKVFVGKGLHQNEEWIEISCNVSFTEQTKTTTLFH